MNFYIIIPAYNEEQHLPGTLRSLLAQTLLPKKIIVVNDGSSDTTQDILDQFSTDHSCIKSVQTKSDASHTPGAKIVAAFQYGMQHLDEKYDVICKFDADLIFPKNYLETLAQLFKSDARCGMAGGFCYIQKNEAWVLENLTNKDHIRGALKAYRKECFQQIGGLKNTMGWDTIDELLVQYNGWKVLTDTNLIVKHLKPTGKAYTKAAKFLQGEAFYKMRYGLILTSIASLKLAVRKKSFLYFIHCMQGYLKAKKCGIVLVVTEKEGSYIRSLRWRNIRKKIF